MACSQLVAGSKGEGRAIVWDTDPVFESDLRALARLHVLGPEPEWESGGTPRQAPRRKRRNLARRSDLAVDRD
jgi:hypothetical protein